MVDSTGTLRHLLRPTLRGMMLFILVSGFQIAMAASVPDAIAAKPPDSLTRLGPHYDPKDLLRERIRQNRAELRQLLLVDSVMWQKMMWAKSPDADTANMARSRRRSKQAGLASFCIESHFPSLAEVDSLREMKREDMDFCKSQLKSANPMIPSVPEAQ